MVAKDRTVSSLVNELATTEVEFDLIAKVIETGESDYARELSGEKRAALRPYMTKDTDDEIVLDDLEVGVAGLVYALSVAGAYPAASCRGHPGANAWSDRPVVLFAIDRRRAGKLESLVRDTGCGFEIDPRRRELLAVCSCSIKGTLSLAEAIIRSLPEFRACDESNQDIDSASRPSLFDEGA
jgi:hypothetical protein